MRGTLDLNGLWRFVPDLDPQYHDTADYARVGWDRRNWQVVRIPSCWNLYGEKYALYEGVAWFARAFHLRDWSPEHIGVLRFGAINYEAQVYVNGELAGEHSGGYTEFTLDVSHLLHGGENLVVVRVDDRRHRILLPACIGWFNYGGIHRDVSLEVTRLARLDWAGISAVPAPGGAGAHLRVQTRSTVAEPLRLAAAVSDHQGKLYWQGEFALQADEARLEAEFPLAGVEPWSLAAPALYRLHLRLSASDGEALDEMSTPFGVRAIATDGERILLNGEPIWLRGICYIPDHPLTGIAGDPDVIESDLDELQRMGVNALRLHTPAHPHLLSECDRRGMLVSSESPLYCLAPKEDEGSAFADPRYLALAQQMQEEMIRAGYSHPSIAIWSLGNECAVSHPEALAFFRQLAGRARALDSSRLLTYASLYGEMGEVGDLVDVIGVNEYWGWYDRLGATPEEDRQLLEGVTFGEDGARTLSVGPLDLDRLRQEIEAKRQRYNKPILLTEFGADAVPAYRSADLRLWSEDYQALLLERTIALALASEGVSGAFPFCYQDYPDPSKYVGTYWAGLNLKGVVTYDREAKLARDVLGRAYRRNVIAG